MLDARLVRKAFRGNQAVDGVTASLDSGEILALVGPNGAGKSTLLNILTGHERPDTGTVRINGVDVTRLPPSHRRRRRIARSYQDGGTFLRLTALENVMIPAVARSLPLGSSRSRAYEVLERLGLGDVANLRGDRLSGGQRKLLDVARSFTFDASLALLDEPTAGVNPALATEIREMIVERQRVGMAFIIVSHDLPWAFEFCGRVLVMATGETIAQGAPDYVVNDRKVMEAYLA